MKAFLILFLICLPIKNSKAAVSDSLFNISNNIIVKVQEFSINMFHNIALGYRDLYKLMLMIVFPMIFYAYAKNKIDEEVVITFFIAVMISSFIALKQHYFKYFIYDPFFDTLDNMTSFIIQSVKFGGESNFGNKVGNILGIMYDRIGEFNEDLDKIKSNIDFGITNFLKPLALVLTIWLLKIIYIFLVAVFAVNYITYMVSANVIIIIMPITLSLFPFKSLRPYAFNHIKYLFQIGLTIVFQCIAVALTIYLMGDILMMTKELINNGDSILNYSFMVSSIITAGLGYLLLLKSNDFSSRILNVAGGSNLLANSAMNKMAGALTGTMLLKNFAINSAGAAMSGINNHLDSVFGRNKNNNPQQQNYEDTPMGQEQKNYDWIVKQKAREAEESKSTNNQNEEDK